MGPRKLLWSGWGNPTKQSSAWTPVSRLLETVDELHHIPFDFRKPDLGQTLSSEKSVEIKVTFSFNDFSVLMACSISYAMLEICVWWIKMVW